MVKLLWSTGGARIVNQQTSKHTLGYVCKSHHSHILQFLLKHQPDLALNEIVSFCDDDGISIIDDEMPMLNYAAKLGFDSIVNIILKYHYNGDTSIVPSLDKNGNTPLHMAWSKKVAKQLLRRSGIGILTNTNNNGQTPIECVKDRLKNIKRICNYNLERIERQTDEMKKTITFYEKYMPKQNQQQSQEGGQEEEDHQDINNVTVLSATTRIEENNNNNNNIDNDDPDPSSFSFDDIPDNTGSGTARLRAVVEQTEEENSITSSSRTVVAAVLSQKSYRRHSHKQPLLTVSNNSSPPPTTASPSSTTETNNCIHSSFITNVDSRKRPRLLNSTSTTTTLMREVVSTIAATPQLPLQSQRRDPSTSSPSQSTTLSTVFTNDDDPQEGTESMTQISSALTNTSSTLRVEETDEESGGKPNDIDINTVVVENQDNNNDNLAIPPSILPISPTNNEFQMYDDALLSETEEEEYPLHTSVKFGYINLVEEELQKIISNTNTVDGGGGSRNKETTTTTTENTSPTSSLLNTIDSKGRTALDLAALTGQLTIVDRLREAGCIYKYKNNSRMTAIANLRSKDVTMYLDKVRLSV
jgi:ankyrin repeat protein